MTENARKQRGEGPQACMCFLCGQVEHIDYKDVLSEKVHYRTRILPRKIPAIAKHQRQVTEAIKGASHCCYPYS